MDTMHIKEIPTNKTSIWDDYVPILRSADGRETTIYLTEVFESIADYSEAVYILETARPGDKIKFIIANGGGNTAAAYYLIDGINNSKAKISCHCTGFVASAATVVAMACPTLTIADNTNFMCHNYAHNAGGSGAQIKEYVDFIDREFIRATKEEYSGFLTDEEIVLITKHDKEVWLNSEDVRERWANRQAYIKALKTKKDV